MSDREATGVVDFFNDTGGYGFIETDQSDEDVFFHMEDIGGEDLTEGTEIAFDIEQAPKGPRATNVVRVTGSRSEAESTSGRMGGVLNSSPSDDPVSGDDGQGPDNTSGGSGRGGQNPERYDYDAVGRVDFFNDTGGYGFMTTDQSDEDVFFHMEDIGGEDLTEGTEVAFDIEQAPKGPRAENVVRDPSPDLKDAVRQSGSADPDGGGEDTVVYRPDDSEGSDGDTVVYRPDEDGSGADTGTDAGEEPADHGDTEVYAPTGSGADEYCPQCGRALSEYDDADFCPDCGSNLSS
jgi:CspA family cold shock protein